MQEPLERLNFIEISKETVLIEEAFKSFVKLVNEEYNNKHLKRYLLLKALENMYFVEF